MKRVKLLILSLFCASSLLGCVAGGASFQALEPGPEDMGLIYFYRPNIYAGSAVDIMLVDNGEDIQKIQNGQFIRYLATPGQHKFHTDTSAIDKPLNMEIEAGKSYFIRTGVRMGMWTGTWYLTRVYDEEALDEMKACCKTGSPRGTTTQNDDDVNPGYE